MKRTAFVCLGSRQRGDALYYQELPTKESGEEFFIFFEPGHEDHKPLIQQLFRDAISAPRLGHPLKYFLQFIDRLNTVAGMIDRTKDLLADSILAIMIRRRKDVYLFHNAGIEVVHWDGGAGEERPALSITGFADMPLRKMEAQGNLFSRFTEELFVLKTFTLIDGNHTLVLAPSREFVSRNREPLRNSIFFPAFELSPEGEVTVETDRSFPAIHWNTTGGENVKHTVQPERKTLRRISIPATVGILTALVVFLLFFGPWSRKESVDSETRTPVLLSADDSGRVVGTREETAAPDNADQDRAEGSGEARRDVALAEAWNKSFSAPVTSSPQIHGGTVYFGCRDTHVYAFASDGTMKWNYNAGEGVGASPCCISRHVIVADYGGDISCLDAESGSALWSYATNERIVSSPQAQGDMVLIATMEGNLVALSVSEGTKLWSQKLGAGIWANVYLADRYIVAATTEGSLVRLDHNGKIEWRVKPGGGILSSPLCLEGDDLIVFGSKDTYIYAYSLSRGSLMWRAVTGGQVNGAAVSDGETILIGSDDGYIYALSLSGQIRWKRDLGGAVKSRPLIVEGTALITSYGARIYALNVQSGEITGEHRVDAPVYSSPIHDGTKVYFGSNDGTFHALWMYGDAS